MHVSWEALTAVASLFSSVAVLAAVLVAVRQVRVGAALVDNLRCSGILIARNVHHGKFALGIALAITAIVATTAPAASACGSGIAVSDVSNIAWMENPFPRPAAATYVELDRWAELSQTGPRYYGVRYVYSRPRTVERPGDAAALFAAAARIIVDAGFFTLDRRRGRPGIDGIYRTVSAKRCETTVQFEFTPGDDPRLDALFAQLTELARGAAWSPAKGEPPERIPIFHLPTAYPDP